ncbi:hypothetical protein D3C84_995040 [compost metagenome]
MLSYPSGLGLTLAECLNLSVERLSQGFLSVQGFGLLPSFTEQAFIVAIEPRQIVLFHGDGLPQLALLNLQFMKLRLVLALILISLFLRRLSIVLERPTGLNVLFFQ